MYLGIFAFEESEHHSHERKCNISMYVIEWLNITQQMLSIICVSGAVQGPGDAAKDALFPAFVKLTL